MPKYQITEKGIQEARRKKTTLKGLGEAITFGGPWKGEDYSNILLISLLVDGKKARDAASITRGSFNKPRPSEAKVTQTLNHLVDKGYVRMVGHSGFSDKSGQCLSRKHRKGFKRVKFT